MKTNNYIKQSNSWIKKLGLSLDEIKEYLKTNDNKLLERSLDKYEEKIRLLKDFMRKQKEKKL